MRLRRRGDAERDRLLRLPGYALTASTRFDLTILADRPITREELIEYIRRRYPWFTVSDPSDGVGASVVSDDRATDR
jgi:hypothetical protein